MIHIQCKIERDVYVATSGGVDSMAIVDFLYRSHNVTMMFFHHGTDTSEEAMKFLLDYQMTRPSLKLVIGYISREKNSDESQEEYWRNQRYEWLHSHNHDIITCHHLDDCVETWIWSSMHGEGKIIPYRNRNVYRPFMLNRKSEFLQRARNKNVPWVEDASNNDTKYMRNYIRHEMVQKCLVVNPGLHKVIRKKVEAQYLGE